VRLLFGVVLLDMIGFGIVIPLLLASALVVWVLARDRDGVAARRLG